MERQFKNPAAVALGRLGKGVKKNFTPEEIQRRTDRIQKVNARRRKRHDDEAKQKEEFKEGVKILAGIGEFVPVGGSKKTL